ncbi:tyrosine-type recombinase/integrase [Actinomycetota bacterium]
MKKVIEIFRTREELDKLVSTPNPKYKSGIRNRAILAVLCYAGLRVGELINLKSFDLKEKDSAIKVNNAKWKSSRLVYVPNYLFHYIDKWKEVRPNSKYLFCSRYGKKLLPDYMQKMVKRYAKIIALDKDVHPHCLRHSIATIWLKEGKPIRGIQQQLGHNNLNTTQIYLDYFDDDRKKDFLDSDRNIADKIKELSKELEQLKTILKK